MSTASLFSRRFLWQSLLIWGLVGFLMLPGRAADVSVRANLNRSITPVGEPVQYSIRVTGSRRSLNAPDVKAEGLATQFVTTTESSVTRFNNGNFSSERTVSFIYQVSAEKAGSFTIPAVAVSVDGQQYRTEPVALTVQSGSASGGGGGGSGKQQQATGFAEIVVPKTTVYVGETIPLEVRLYVDARVRWEPAGMPEITGEGFTKQKSPEPRSQQVEKDGRMYDLVVFKTAITASRAGKLTIGPVETPFNARVPRARPSGGPRSLFDDDIFGDPIFSSVQQFKPKAAAIEFNVKPLPAEGRPPLFAGAVGSFQLASEASPVQVKVGDPVTMKMRITGRGNFDRMTAPPLKDALGWRAYPSSNSFKADDDINYSGTKTFEMAVVPETKKTTMPVFEFSYFDPSIEKYVTLTSAATPLDVTPSLAPAATPTPSAESVTKPKPPGEAPRPNDIMGQNYDLGPALESRPLYQRREFWVAQGGVGLALVAFLGLRLRRAPNAAARVAASLREEKTIAWARLRGGNLGAAEFYEVAARLAQIETALATGKNAGSIDAASVHGSIPLHDDARAVIDEVFAARAELLYAGHAGGAPGSVSAGEREKVMNVLRQLEKSHGRS